MQALFNYILKISGAGNRFLLVDKHNFNVDSLDPDWEQNSYKTDGSFEEFAGLAKADISYRRSFIKNLLSQPSLSLADGLIVLKRKSNNSFHCDFYNKDGSTAEMCGNASCCVSMYAHWQSFPLKTLLLGETELACIEGGGIALKKINPSIVDFNEQGYSFSFINTGVPHGVIELSDKLAFSNKTELKNLAKKLRFRNINKQKGMNVSFYQVIQSDKLTAITYERGIEDWTLACGTGALASALVYLNKHPITNVNAVFVKMPGGELKVQVKPHLSLFSPIQKGF